MSGSVRFELLGLMVRLVLTVGSFYPCLRFGFFCDWYLQVGYAVGITVAGISKPDFIHIG